MTPVKVVLLVDDEFGNIDVLSIALEEEGYRVMTAANGRQGLERLREQKPDVVITDFMMPLMDGAEMAHAIRADPAVRAIPIVIMSAVTEAAVRARFDDYQGFLRKPFGLSNLIELLAALLKRPGEQFT